MQRLVYPFIRRWTLRLFPWPESGSESVSRSVMSDSLRPHGSSAHGILHTGTLEWVAIPFSRGSSQPRGWAQVSHIAGRFFTVWAPGKPLSLAWLLCVLKSSGAWRLGQPSVEQDTGDLSGLHNVADSGGPCSSSLFPAISTYLSFALKRMKLQCVLHMVTQKAGKLVAHLASLSGSGKLFLGGELPLGVEQRGMGWCRQTETALSFLFGTFSQVFYPLCC